METISRDDAVKEFGRSVQLTSFGMPPYQYPQPPELQNFENNSLTWARKSKVSPSLTMVERLGGKQSVSEDRHPWLIYIDNIFSGDGVISSEDVAAKIKLQAISSHDLAKLTLEKELSQQNFLQSFIRDRVFKAEPLLSGEDVFSSLSINVQYLADELKIPSVRLSVGTNVYGIVNDDTELGGTKIATYIVTSRKISTAYLYVPRSSTFSLHPSHVPLENTYDICYSVRSKNECLINFTISAAGSVLIEESREDLSSGLFLTRDEAEAARKELRCTPA